MDLNADEMLTQTSETRLDCNNPIRVPVRGGRLGADDLVDLSRRGRFLAIDGLEDVRGVVMDRDPERKLCGQQEQGRENFGNPRVLGPPHCVLTISFRGRLSADGRAHSAMLAR